MALEIYRIKISFKNKEKNGGKTVLMFEDCLKESKFYFQENNNDIYIYFKKVMLHIEMKRRFLPHTQKTKNSHWVGHLRLDKE